MHPGQGGGCVPIVHVIAPVPPCCKRCHCCGGRHQHSRQLVVNATAARCRNPAMALYCSCHLSLLPSQNAVHSYCHWTTGQWTTLNLAVIKSATMVEGCINPHAAGYIHTSPCSSSSGICHGRDRRLTRGLQLLGYDPHEPHAIPSATSETCPHSFGQTHWPASALALPKCHQFLSLEAMDGSGLGGTVE